VGLPAELATYPLGPLSGRINRGGWLPIEIRTDYDAARSV